MTGFVADLHIHSRFSRATSKSINLVQLALWARKKGLSVVGTGDFTHPAWFAELSEQLQPTGDGLYRLADDLERQVDELAPPACRRPVRFMLQVEISNIYKRADKVRKVHNLVYMPSLEAAARFNEALERVGNIRSDGRPILGLDSRDLLEMVLETDEQAFLIPAHVWTPWFSVLGSKSGFDSIEACYGDLTSHIFALETGLSSDPPMNWRLSQLDRYLLVSNSDAHSPSKLAREANLFSCEMTYPAMLEAMRTGRGFEGTVEFFPEEGKYHLDGHRKCGVRLTPKQTAELGGRCPVCGKPVTVGVLHRVEELADRPDGDRPGSAKDFVSLVGLANLLAEVHGRGPATKTVTRHYEELIATLGGELTILRDLPLDEILVRAGELVTEAVSRIRKRQVQLAAGFDGEYGTISLFSDQERRELAGQGSMFPQTGSRNRAHRPVGSVSDDDEGRAEVGMDSIESLPLFPGLASGVGEAAVTQAAGSENAGRVERPSGAQSHGTGASAQAKGRILFSDSSVDMEGEEGEEAEGGKNGEGVPLDLKSLPLFPGLAAMRSGPAFGGFAEPASDPEELLWGLTEEQRDAVEGPAPMCILAGPGAGKTRVLTTRIAHRMLTGTDPSQILAVTFTNLAARQLQERIAAMVGPRARFLTVNTFHGFCADLVRKMPGRFGVDGQLHLVGRNEQDAMLAFLAPKLSSRKRKQVLALQSATKTGRDRKSAVSDDEDVVLAAGALQEYMEAQGLWDLDDLMARPVAAMEQDRELALSVQGLFSHLFVDEYQDVSPIQERLLALLVPPGSGGDVTVIGDPDQSIYGFRGADPLALERFVADRPDCRVVRLSRSFRSPDLVLRAAGRIVGHDEDTRIRSQVRFPSGRIPLAVAATEKAEAEYVVSRVERILGGTGFFSLDSGRAEEDDQGAGFGDVAVLFRTRHQADALVEAFARSGMPYELASSDGDAQAGLDVLLAVVRLASAPQDDVWRSWLASRVEAYAEARAGVDAAWLSRRALALALDLDKGLRWGQFLDRALAWLWSESPKEAEQVRQEAGALGREVPIEEVAIQASLQSAQDRYHPRSERVHLMTIHAAKGLEFDRVFITGFEDGLLPLVGADLEEERRLLYVALTRASRHLEVTAAQTRENRPSRVSRFLDDITAWMAHKQAFVPRRRPRQMTLFGSRKK